MNECEKCFDLDYELRQLTTKYEALEIKLSTRASEILRLQKFEKKYRAAKAQISILKELLQNNR